MFVLPNRVATPVWLFKFKIFIDLNELKFKIVFLIALATFQVLSSPWIDNSPYFRLFMSWGKVCENSV